MPRGNEILKEEIVKFLDSKLKGKSPKNILSILKRSLKVFTEFCIIFCKRR